MRKFVSLLLTAVLLTAMLTVFAVPASAEGEEVSTPENAKWFENSKYPVWWELTDNETVLPDGKTGRTLTVGGKGKMPDYVATTPTLDKRPWKGYIETITTVVIDSGVTNLGNFVFYGCKSLQSVTIPSSVTSIGNGAFHGCASLQSVTIPYGVTRISPSAFMNCTSLQSVTIPSSVTMIYTIAFAGCRKLASVTVKTSTPPTLGQKAFDSTADDLAIYVPCGLGEKYQQASGWSDKSDQIKEAYIVDDQPGENGTIMLDKDCFPVGTFAEEQTVTVSVVPAEGYQLQADSLTVFYKDGEEEKTVELTQDETDPTKYSFEMPKANVTLKASFEAISDGTGSILSGGSLWIILGVAAVIAVAAVVAVVVVKKKKKVNE